MNTIYIFRLSPLQTKVSLLLSEFFRAPEFDLLHSQMSLAISQFPEIISFIHLLIHLFIYFRDTRLTKAWTAIDRLSIIWKSDLTDKMNHSLFQAAVVSILLYGCTTWTLTKRLEKKLDGNYTRMLRAILNKSWRQHPTRRQLHGHLPPPSRKLYRLDEPDTQDTAGEARTSS